jgi:hypothetical protein
MVRKCGQGGSIRLGIEMFNLSAREVLIILTGGKLEDGKGLSRDIREKTYITYCTSLRNFPPVLAVFR